MYADDETGSLHPVPRGYAGDPFEEAAVAGASVEYRLPLAYPDAGLGSWLHVPRLTAAAFGDLAWEPAAAAASLRATAGVELAADLEVLVPLPVRVGVQLIWRFEDGRLAFRETLLGLTAVLER